MGGGRKTDLLSILLTTASVRPTNLYLSSLPFKRSRKSLPKVNVRLQSQNEPLWIPGYLRGLREDGNADANSNGDGSADGRGGGGDVDSDGDGGNSGSDGEDNADAGSDGHGGGNADSDGDGGGVADVDGGSDGDGDADGDYGSGRDRGGVVLGWQNSCSNLGPRSHYMPHI